MTKQEIFERINELIVEEKGQPVPIDGLFMDSGLDSLGVLIVSVQLDEEFGLFQGEDSETAFESVDFTTLTMRELVQQCRLSSTST